MTNQHLSDKEIKFGLAIKNLAKTITPIKTQSVQHEGAMVIWQACQKIANYAHIILPHIEEHFLMNHPDPLEIITRKANIRKRQVHLSRNWFKEDHGPILGFLKKNNSPVALLPTRDFKYIVYDPHTGSTYKLEDPSIVDSNAWIFYRTFSNKIIYFKDLVKFSQYGNSRDWLRIFAMVVMMGIVLMALPYGFGKLTHLLLSGVKDNELLFLVTILSGGVVAGACCTLTRGLSVVRIQGHTDSKLQAAVIDRLLKLPLSFYRKYKIGDLGLRAMGINQIRLAFTGVNLLNMLSSLIGVFYLIFIACYSIPIAIVTFILLAILCVITFLAGWKMLSYTRKETTLQGSVTSKILQYIQGIAKIRLSAAEPLAFTLWAQEYSKQQKNIYKSQLILCRIIAFNQMFPFIANLILFASFAIFVKNLSLITASGTFLAINAAFGTLMGLTLNLSQTLLQIINVIPTYERLRPILQAAPEADESKTDPGILKGHIETQHLSFKYAPNLPWILKDITLNIKPEEYVAIVGESGGGKSTFLRQNALIAIMAQIGSYVPATKAHIGCVDKLFSRVGASDNLAKGQSTFMVEMTETATILNLATEKSLVILDEIGRGTATYDGLSIAWAVLEHIHEAIKCRTIFATHYHELTKLQLQRLALYSMKVKEWKDNIIFLHEVGAGSADRSYGIHVAQLAGVPKKVTLRAAEILKDLEEKNTTQQPTSSLPLFGYQPEQLQKTKAEIERLERLTKGLTDETGVTLRNTSVNGFVNEIYHTSTETDPELVLYWKDANKGFAELVNKKAQALKQEFENA